MQPVGDDFGKLRRLLALKRHELPPPGFYDRFARDVAARIEEIEHSLDEALFENFLARVPWLRRLWVSLETRPVYAGAFSAVVCLLLFSGLAYSYHIEPAQIGSTDAHVQFAGAPDQPAAKPSPAPVSDRPLFLQINGSNPGATIFPPEARTLLFSSNRTDPYPNRFY